MATFQTAYGIALQSAKDLQQPYIMHSYQAGAWLYSAEDYYARNTHLLKGSDTVMRVNPDGTVSFVRGAGRALEEASACGISLRLHWNAEPEEPKKKPEPELWWQTERRLAREAKLRMIALRNDVRKICGQG